METASFLFAGYYSVLLLVLYADMVAGDDEMTAMERIKDILEVMESVRNSANRPANWKYGYTEESVVFLLKAFKVMREVAIGRHTDIITGKCRYGETKEECIDEEFEEKMK